MKSLLESLAANSGVVILILGLLAIGLLGLCLKLSARIARIEAKWGDLLRDSSTGNLELLLKDHLQERLKLQGDLQNSVRRIETLEGKVATAKRHIGLVRFDAFEDVGGSQSFALAMYDDQGDGVIMNGLIGRSESRVYCKPLVGGRSDRNLSQEEEQAVVAAVSTSPKAVVTR